MKINFKVNFLHKIILASLISFVFSSSTGQDFPKNQNYFIVESGIIADKMFPKIIFYTPKSYDTTTLDWIYFFEVDTSTYKYLQNFLEKKLYQNVERKDKYYVFSVIYSEVESVFFSIDKKNTVEIFEKILDILKNYQKLPLARQVFEGIKKRLY